MTRKFWGGMILTSLLLTGGAAAFLYLKTKNNGMSGLTLTPAPVMPASVPKESTSSNGSEGFGTGEPATAPPSQVESTIVQPDTPAPVKAIPLNGKRNILFTWSKGSPKKVSIIGDFNKWNRTALKKTDKRWELSVPMAPGSYEYLYVVDDKRVKDPNNKSVSPGGKSLLKVKPLTP